MKSITESLLEITAKIAEIGRIHRKFDSKSEAYPYYTDLIGDVHYSLKIVTDTGEPILFEHSPFMKETIEDAINRKGVNIQFVFHVDEDYNRAVEQFSRVNTNLLRLSRDSFPKLYFSLHWVPKRLKLNYSVIDNDWVYYEHPH